MATSQAAQTALSFFQGKGWTPAQAAGIVGNLQVESQLNPQAFNGKGGGNGAIGIAQWRGSRQTDFQSFAGVPLSQSTYQQQLDFVNYELTQGTMKSAGTKLKATTTAADAATAVDKYYEISDGADLQKRINNANSLTGSGPNVPTTQAPSEVAPEEVTAAPDAPLALLPIPNRLHQYPSYIYGLSLHLLTDEEYNQVVEKETYTPKRVLIASAGRWSPDNFPRSEFFSEDFYFEDLNMTTIISPNDFSRNTNAIETSFTIIEPYGFTLMERLLKAADAIKSANYLDMPYLLQIDFFTIDDSGKIVGSVDALRKRIPIKLVKMDMRVSVKGSQYSISAVPFNHSAYDTTTVTTPANFEITASTVFDFFQSTEGTPADPAFAGNQVPGERAVTQQYNQGPNFSGTASNTVYTKAKSYGTAINDYFKNLEEDRKLGNKDVYRFEFDEEIGKSTFVHSELNTPKRTPFKDNTGKDIISMKRADLGGEQGIYDSTKVIFQVNFGTTIEKLLEYVIRNSDYIQDQLVVPEDADYESKKKALEKEPLKWFKIVPRVRLLGFDQVRKIWAREITYQIKSYKMYNIRSSLGPQGVQLHPVKNYSYIYTGQNDDVFDFDITFNALYYTQVTSYRDNLTEVTPTAASATTDNQYQNAPNWSGDENSKTTDYNAVTPSILKSVVQNSQATATGGATTARQVASVDLADSLMTNSQADMLNVKLKILGDPDYIKQDDIFYRPVPTGTAAVEVKPSSDPRLLPNDSSLAMDDGALYVQVLFRTPIDIDESTGLMKFDDRYQHSLFSGLYQVIQVTSNFHGGQFTQDLDLVRMPRQSAFDYVNGQNNKSDQRSETTKAFPGQLGVTESPPIIPSLLQSGGAQKSTADASDTAIDQTPGQDQQAAQEANNVPPLLTQNAQDLRVVNETAPEETITAQTEPQAIAPNFTPISSRGNRVPGATAIV